jgi:protein disulfide-isomerase
MRPRLAQLRPLLDICSVKKLIASVGLSFAVLVTAHAASESEWFTDFKKAQQEAKTSNKLVLLDFTGSDWCGWCIQFDRQILSKPEFKDYARKNLVLVELDYPRRKALSLDTRKQNEQLAQQYQIEGFPTVVVLDGEGKSLWRYDGYFPDGAAAFIAQLEKLRKG